jgi:hypothetical protein
MATPNDHLIAKLSAFCLCILALILLLIFSGCAPARTRPANLPFPTTLGPQMPGGIYGINQTRCFGGGIGGCSLGGKAIGGPVSQ